MITPNTKFWTHEELLTNLIRLINLVEGDDILLSRVGLQEAFEHAEATLIYARKNSLALPDFSKLDEQ